MMLKYLMMPGSNPIRLILQWLFGGGRGGGGGSEHLYLVDDLENPLTMENNDELIRR